MATQRSYHDMCGMAHALDLVGERWALLVVRELTLAPKRFTDLRSELPGISANVLSNRLGELERVGVLTRRKLPPPAAVSVYELTEWGAELEPIITKLGRWGARSPLRPHAAGLSATSLILSLRTNFDPRAAVGADLRIELRLREHTFHATVEDGTLEAAAGPAPAPEAVVTADPVELAALLYGGQDAAAAIEQGRVSVSGDRATFSAFLGLFPLPELATVPE